MFDQYAKEDRFDNQIMDVIWRLLANNKYYILINDKYYGLFYSTKGVMQEEHLSPTLFILFAEALARPLNSFFHYMDFKSFGMSNGVIILII